MNGPFYPENNVTRESLLAYAARCREQADRPAESRARALPPHQSIS